MRKFIIGSLILVPVVAAAAGMPMGGAGFDAGGPPGDRNVDTPEDPQELFDRGTLAREKAAYAADLLYPAAEKAFNMAGEVTPLPTLSRRWKEVAGADSEPIDEGAPTGEDALAAYRREFDARRAAFAAAWKNKTERVKIIDRWRQSRAAVLAAQEDFKAAADISETAGDELDAVTDRFREFEDMAAGRPGMGGMPMLDKRKMPSAADIAAMETAAKEAAAQEKIAKDLLKKFAKAL